MGMLKGFIGGVLLIVLRLVRFAARFSFGFMVCLALAWAGIGGAPAGRARKSGRLGKRLSGEVIRAGSARLFRRFPQKSGIEDGEPGKRPGDRLSRGVAPDPGGVEAVEGSTRSRFKLGGLAPRAIGGSPDALPVMVFQLANT